MCAWLKNASETENDSSTSRSRCSSCSGRRGSMNGSTKQHAQRQPDVQRVHVPAERARIAARHRPRDLKPGPLFEHLPARVGDDHLPDLFRALSWRRSSPASAPGPSGTAPPNEPGYSARTAFIFGSASAIASTLLGRQPAPGRGDVRGSAPARGFRRPSPAWSSRSSASESCSPRARERSGTRTRRRRSARGDASAEGNGGARRQPVAAAGQPIV